MNKIELDYSALCYCFNFYKHVLAGKGYKLLPKAVWLIHPLTVHTMNRFTYLTVRTFFLLLYVKLTTLQ